MDNELEEEKKSEIVEKICRQLNQLEAIGRAHEKRGGNANRSDESA